MSAAVAPGSARAYRRPTNLEKRAGVRRGGRVCDKALFYPSGTALG